MKKQIPALLAILLCMVMCLLMASCDHVVVGTPNTPDDFDDPATQPSQEQPTETVPTESETPERPSDNTTPPEQVESEPSQETPSTEPTECTHDWQITDCNAPKTCSKCGATDGDEAAGHSMDPESGFCQNCGEFLYDLTFVANDYLKAYTRDMANQGFDFDLLWVRYLAHDGECFCAHCNPLGENSAGVDCGAAFMTIVYQFNYLYQGDINNGASMITFHKTENPSEKPYAVYETAILYERDSETFVDIIGVFNDDLNIRLTVADMSPVSLCADGHTWGEANCLSAAACLLCNEPNGTELGNHHFKDATCGYPSTCIACGETQGEPTGAHTVDKASGVCTECYQFAYDIDYVANQIILDMVTGFNMTHIDGLYYVENTDSCPCPACDPQNNLGDPGDPFFTLICCFDTVRYENEVLLVSVHKNDIRTEGVRYSHWINAYGTTTWETDENGNVTRIDDEKWNIHASVNDLPKVNLSCENGQHLWANADIQFPQQCVICGKAVTSADYAYLAGTLFRSIKNDYPHADPHYAYVTLYKNLEGDVCVLVDVWYKIQNNYNEYVVYNLTTGKRINNPDQYYKKLANNAYGQNKIHYIQMSTEVLQHYVDQTEKGYFVPGEDLWRD